MEWQLAALAIFGGLVILMATGLPVALCFLVVNVVFMFFFYGGELGLIQLVVSFVDSLSTFTLLPLPLFILMGEVLFHSGMAPRIIRALDNLMGRLPGRLGLLAVGAGTLLATLSGSSMASVAILGSVLTPDMEKLGYKKPMSLGPILGSGGLAVMIPPSGWAVVLAVIAEASVGRVLIAIIIPGLLMAVLYATYIITRCAVQPSLAPSGDISRVPLSKKLGDTVRYILPVGVIIFLVTGVIILGIATPSEAAATGTFGCFALAACYKRLNWEVLKKSVNGAFLNVGMVFLIIGGATAFSQVLAFSGIQRGIGDLVMGFTIAPIIIVMFMMVVVFIMGMFMTGIAIMMITLPIFIPIVIALGFDPVWFLVLFLLNLEMGLTSPPFGMNLFIMKGVGPPDTTLGDIIRAALPFILCDLIALVLIMVFPVIALWLPGIMR